MPLADEVGCGTPNRKFFQWIHSDLESLPQLGLHSKRIVQKISKTWSPTGSQLGSHLDPKFCKASNPRKRHILFWETDPQSNVTSTTCWDLEGQGDVDKHQNKQTSVLRRNKTTESDFLQRLVCF